MYQNLSPEEKNIYIKHAKNILKGTFVECKDCSIYSGTGYFISSYQDEKKLEETAEKIFLLLTEVKQEAK